MAKAVASAVSETARANAASIKQCTYFFAIHNAIKAAECCSLLSMDPFSPDDTHGGLIDALQSAGASRMFAAGATSATPLDLNDEKNLTDLEDANLQEHMRLAREQAIAFNIELGRLPALAELVQDSLTAGQALSAVSSGITAHLMAIQCASDEVQLAARNAGRLAGGCQPHGYPAAGPAALLHLEKKIDTITTTLGAAIVALESLAREHTLARRMHDQALGKQKRRCEHFETAFTELVTELNRVN